MIHTQSKLRSVVATLCMFVVSSPAFAAIDFSGVTALADRLGSTALTSKVSFEEIADKSVEKAQIVPVDASHFTIKATSVHAASLAMGVYLRDVAKGHISWCGKRMPTEWAVPTETIAVQARYPYAMAYNYCTLSYTMAYWSTAAWQNEIDRLALSGYSQALVMAGVQEIWKRTMADLDYTKQQQQDFITDDAVQAWWLMGNLQAIGNFQASGHYPVVSDDEIAEDAKTGKFIVEQMRAVGIEPILQGFIGLVPSTTTKTQLVTYLNNNPEVCSKYGITDPSAKESVNIFVNGYYVEGQKNPDLIDPNCKIFKLFSDTWNKNLKDVYGMDTPAKNPKFLGGDLFHESSPPGSMTYEEKVNCAKGIQANQQQAFPGVTWVLQSWQGSPDQTLRDGLDPAHTVIQFLDQTMSDTGNRNSNYYNQIDKVYLPWVWVEVMNFGGNTGMHGAFRRFRNVGNLGDGNANFRGYGLLSEGLETNPISYDMYNSRFTETTQDAQNISDAELEPWMAAYRERRYGLTDAENNGSASLKAANTICARTVWDCNRNQQGTIESVFCAFPAYNVAKVSAWGPTTGTPYDPAELVTAARHFLEAAQVNSELLELETFRYDFVEIFQQILADRARQILPDCATSRAKRNEFRKMLELLDRILACSDEWRLDKKEARLVGKAPTTGPAAYRRMITTWTPGQRGQTQLSQYAHRSYAGLVKNYYAKKWNAFFDVTEGNMTSAAYNALCADLDANFPYTDLTTADKATPAVETLDPVAIAEEILLLINPPALTWTNAAGNNCFDDKNWKNVKNETVAWEDGMNAVLSGYDTTITASSEVRVGDISFERYQLPADLSASTYLNDSEEQVVFNNLSLETLHNSLMTATMGGSGWFGNNNGTYRSAAATGYFKSAISGSGDGSSFTVNFQCLDDSWVKATTVKFIQSGSSIKAITTGTGAKSNGTLGADNLTTGTTAPANSTGYGIKALNYLAPSKLALDGAITVEGKLALDDSDITVKRASMIGGEIAINGGTLTSVISSDAIVSSITVGEKGGTFVVPNKCNMTINSIVLEGTKKLVLKGSAETLKGLEGGMLISIPRDCISKVVYVSSANPSEEQVLKFDTDGYLKTKIGTLSYDSFVTSTATKTNWKNVALSDLAECEFTGTMGGKWVKDGSNARGYLIEKTADAVTFLMQKYDTDENTKSVKITLTIGNDGFVYIKASEPKYTPKANVPGTIPTTAAWQNTLAESATAEGYGVASVTITPAVAQVSDIVSNYSVLTSAITAANGTKKVTLLDDATVTSSINNNYKTWIEIPRGITLSATCGDFIFWDKAYTLDIYGTLDLGVNALSVGASKSHVINLYAGGEIKTTNAKGLAIFDANTTINVKANAGFETATLNTPVQARQNTTIAVEEGVMAVLSGGIVLKAGGESGVDNPVVTKTGAGTLEFNGAIKAGASLVLSAGTLTRVMPDKDTLTVTINGGTANILPIDDDHKIVEEVNGSVHTYTCQEKHFCYRVTEPGEISVNMPGVDYETLEEALAAAIALQAANPKKEVMLWILSSDVADQCKDEIAAYNAAHSTNFTVFGDGNGIAVQNWNTNVPGQKAPFEDVLAIVGRLAGGYNGAEVEGLDKTKADAAMAKFEFVQVADTVVAKGAAIVDAHEGKIRIQASDASGASFGLGQYLRNTAKMHISWCGNRVTDNFPLPSAKATTYTPAVPVRFAYNYCTLSYTMAFWSAKEWREEIDRLALSGYNVALVLQGLQEAWRVTLESVKKSNGDRVYSDEQIMKYVSDEAAQAWWHMGNLEGLGGPLGSDKGAYGTTEDEINAAYERFKARTAADAVLGEYIYAEMMKLGIQPSIQSFVGLVPDCSNQVLADGYAKGQRFGDAANWGIINEGAWQGYTRPDVVNPLNIAFDEMSKAWYGALVEIYKPEVNGYTSYMGGDLFHEGGNKGSLTDANLAQIAKKIQDTQAEYFGKNGNVVTWVLQSWQGSPYQGIRNGLDTSKAIIQLLDKDMSTTGGVGANYYAYKSTGTEHIPWIWVEVLNFGGNTGMHGGARRFRNLAKIGTDASHSASFKGYGILSEGLETNPMMYDMFNDAFTRTVGQTSSIDDTKIQQWMSDYCLRRYGLVDENLKAAYGVLLNTVFDCSRYQEGCVENMLCAPPDAAVSAVSKWGPKGGIEYDPAELYPAAYAFLDAAKQHPELLELETFRYDFVELFLQLIGERGRVINADIVTPGAKRNLFIKMFDLAERLTASSNRWRLDWHEARTYGVSGSTDNFRGVRGYRRMVTCWADGYAAGQATGLREYAHRAYAGLLKDYYLKRWLAWFDKLDGKITQAQYTAFLSALDDSFMTAELEATPMGDLVALGEEILETLNPPALNLDATTAAVDWTTSTWTDAKGQESAWIDDYDVNLSGVCTVSATKTVKVGSLTLGPSKVQDVALYTGYLPQGEANAVKLFSNMKAEDRARVAYFRGIMNGGWVAEGEAKSYQVNDGSEYCEMQMQRVDDGYLKSVRVRTYFKPSDGCIWGYSVDAGNIKGGTLGANVTGTGTAVATSDSAAGYGIKNFAAVMNSDISLNGDIRVAGTLTVSGGRLTLNSAAQATAPSEYKIENGTLILESAVGTAALKNVTIGAGGKIVIKGTTDAISKISFTGSVLPKGEIVLLNGEEEIPLEVLSNGKLKVKLAAQTFEGTIGTDLVSLGWKNLTNEDLLKCEFISGGVRATNIRIEDNWVKMSFGETEVSLTPFSGIVKAKTTSGSITGLQLNPAVARVDDTGTNYSDFASAWTAAADNGKKVTVIADMEYTGAQKSLGSGYTLTINPGVTFTFTKSDQINYDQNFGLEVYGTIVINGIHQSFGNNNTINLYAGAKVLGGGDSEGGLSIFGENGRVSAFQNNEKGGDIYIEPSIVVRHNNIMWVAENVVVTNKGGLVKASWEANTARSFKKTGAGTYVLGSPVIADNLTVEVNAGKLARALEQEEILTVTKSGTGTTKITSADEDYEVVTTPDPEPETGEVTYKSQGILWLYLVTDPGETAQNGPGKKFKHFDEAFNYAIDLRKKNPGKTVKLWGMVANETIVKKELEEKSVEYGRKLDVVIAPAGMEVVGWDEPVRRYYVSDNGNWYTDILMGKSKGAAADTDIVDGDIVVFYKNFTEGTTLKISFRVRCTEIEVVDSTSLVIGQFNEGISIPAGWTIDIGAGSSITFTGRTDIPDAQFNGKGTVTFDAATGTKTLGKIKGTATLTIPEGVTLVQLDNESFIENELAGKGTLIVKNVNAAYTLAEGSEVKIKAENAGYRAVQNGNIVTFELDIVRAWHQGEGAALATEPANLTKLMRGITIDDLKNGGEYELRAELGGAWMSPALLSHAVLIEKRDAWYEAQFQILDKDGSGYPILKYANVKFAEFTGDGIKGYQSGQGYVSGWDKLGKEWVEQTSGNPTATQYQIKSFAAALHYAVDNTQTWNAQPEDLIREDVVVLGSSAKLTVNYAIKNHISGTGTIVTTVAPSSDLVMALQYQNWKGTCVLDGLTVNGINPSSYGNANSVVELKNCTGYFAGNGSSEGTLKVTGTLNIDNGYGGQTFTLAKLAGDGTINLDKTGLSSFHTIKVLDSTEWTGTINEAAGNSVKIVFAVAKVNGVTYFSVDEAAAAAGPNDTIEILRNEPGMLITATEPGQKIHVPSGFERYGQFTLAPSVEGLWYKTADLPGDTTSILFFLPGNIHAFDMDWTNIYLGPTMVPTAIGDWTIKTDWGRKNGNILLRMGAASYVPAISSPDKMADGWEPALFDGNNMRRVLVSGDGYKHVAVNQLEGWNLRLGAVNGVALDIASTKKLQAGDGKKTLFCVDETSKITIGTIDNNNNTYAEYHVAAEDGLVLPRTMNNIVEYYLSGKGSVKYTGNFNDGTHTIKAADIEIGKGSYKVIRSKKLIALKSDATNTATVSLDANAVITADTGIATTKKGSDVEVTDEIGTYSLRKGTDGVYLDYVGLAKCREVYWDTKYTEWYDATSAATARNKGKALLKSGGTSTETEIQEGDLMIFDTNFTVLGSKHFFIIPNKPAFTGNQKTKNVLIKSGVTLHIGFAETHCNIPNGFHFTLEKDAKIVLTVWGSPTQKDIVLGDNISFDGEGAVEFDAVRVKSATTGSIEGDATMYVSDSVAITAKEGATIDVNLDSKSTGKVVEMVNGVATLVDGGVYPVEAETKYIKIPATVIETLGGSAVLEDKGANELKVWENYVLGLDNDEPTSLPMVTAGQSNDPETFKLADLNVTINRTAGVKVTPKLLEGTPGGAFTEVSDDSVTAEGAGFVIKVPTGDTKVKYYRIKYEIK